MRLQRIRISSKRNNQNQENRKGIQMMGSISSSQRKMDHLLSNISRSEINLSIVLMQTVALHTKTLQNCDHQAGKTSNYLTKHVNHLNKRINQQKIEAKVGFQDAASRVTMMMLQSKPEIIWDIVNKNYQLISQQLKREIETKKDQI